ncbi:MAG: DUF2309 domain-containing protein [Deltaproteobacteria bacterium]|nr:DUF2309 domain-containing protein [Deltaproteobacteria bacterium]
MSAEDTHEGDDPDPSGWRAGLEAAIAHAAHLLPDQGPLNVFIHHNTLHAFQHLPFHEALIEAFRTLGGEPYLREEEYRAEIARGRITREDFEAALGDFSGPAVGSFDPRAVRRDILWNGLDEQTTHTFDYLDLELRVSLEFPKGTPHDARHRITESSTRALLDAAARRDVRSIATMLSKEDDAAAAKLDIARSLEVRLDPEVVARKIERAPEAFAARSLLVACARRIRRQSMRPGPKPRRITHRLALVDLDGPDVATLIDPVFIRLLSAFLDAGLAYWPMPRRELGFWAAFQALYRSPFGPPPSPYLSWARQRLDKLGSDRPIEVIRTCLDTLGVTEVEYERYLGEFLLELPGWAGMVRRLENRPDERPPSAPPIHLLDFIAVRLLLCTSALLEGARRLCAGELPQLREYASTRVESRPRQPADLAFAAFQVLSRLGATPAEVIDASDLEIGNLLDAIHATPSIERRRILHEAFEIHHQRIFLGALQDLRRRDPARQAAPELQLVFCIDDREESTRRHVEEVFGDRVETFGAPGFFGLPIAFKGIDDADRAPSCPIVLSPSHSIDEIVDESSERTRLLFFSRDIRRRLGAVVAHGMTHGSKGLVRGLLSALLVGPFASIPLVVRTIWPGAMKRLMDGLAEAVVPRPDTRLTAFRDHDANPNELPRGFTVEEAADRISAFLHNIGLVRDFAPIVMIVGHHSSSVNNPHQSAYQCGACGGKSGGPNARLFAVLANDSRVREALRFRGVSVPESTHFVSALHDTSRDTLHPFDSSSAPQVTRLRLARLFPSLEAALAGQAHERARRFESLELDAEPSVARAHAMARTVHLAEPRPEYNHATNAGCVVGRRTLTRGLFLDRRAFLVSYDSDIDPTGQILERSLAAALPVCAGINLEYYFSKVDNQIYGSGTKLPHNIAGLIGVMNGHSSDLCTGLWRQTVEIHEPMRLVVVVESKHEPILRVLERQKEVRELVENQWVRLFAIDPDSGSMARFEPPTTLTPGHFLPETVPPFALPEVESSTSWYRGHRNHLPPALIRLGASHYTPSELGKNRDAA